MLTALECATLQPLHSDTASSQEHAHSRRSSAQVRGRFADADCVTEKHPPVQSFHDVYLKTALESEKGKSCFRILAEAAEGVTVSAIFPFARRFGIESWGWGCRWGWGGAGGEYHCNTRKCHPFRLPSLSSFSTPSPIRANLYIFDCVTGHVIRGAVSVLALETAAPPGSRTSNRLFGTDLQPSCSPRQP